MIEVKVIVGHTAGLHARPASTLVREVKGCSTKLTLIVKEQEVNPASILAVLSKNIKQGDEVIIRGEGENEQEDVKKIQEIIEANYDE